MGGSYIENLGYDVGALHMMDKFCVAQPEEDSLFLMFFFVNVVLVRVDLVGCSNYSDSSPCEGCRSNFVLFHCVFVNRVNFDEGKDGQQIIFSPVSWW